ncbi:MAG: TIGR03620 family F420-dependent LLM class oxidoreductase [Sphingomonadaceae bacterium]
MTTPQLGKVGIWSMELRFGDQEVGNALAADLEKMGFGAIWVPGGIDDGVLKDIELLLAATETVTIASGILNIWMHEPADVAAWFAALPAEHQRRVMIGVGVSHGPIIGEAWEKPLAKTRGFLEAALAAGMPRENLCVAALGPKMLALAGELTAGAHPYLVTPEHTKQAREILGPGKLLAPEQGVVFGDSPAEIREKAEGGLSNYRMLPNYRNSWLRLGLTEQDIEDWSDALIEANFATGAVEAMAARVAAHHEAGADHVCVQIVSGAMGGDMKALGPQYRALAEAVL